MQRDAHVLQDFPSGVRRVRRLFTIQRGRKILQSREHVNVCVSLAEELDELIPKRGLIVWHITSFL
jgi:hypothetical protein